MKHTKILKNVCAAILRVLIPEKCSLCRCSSELGFCIDCQKLLPWAEFQCSICGAHLPEPEICGRCQVSPPAYHDASIPFKYGQPISNQIQSLKYAEKMIYAVSMGKMLSLWIMKNVNDTPEIIVPMPLHYRRIMHRGFNQSNEISKVVGRHIGVAVDNSLLLRVKNTVTQTGLSEKMRKQNLRGAFAVKKTHSYRHVAVLDDVVTSGSTANEAARALIRSGVEKVSVWAISKT